MATITVRNTAELTAAIKKAGNGDTILAAPGTYTAALRDIGAKDLTITSLDPLKPATFTSFTATNVSGLTLRSVELFAETARSSFSFSKTNGLTLDKIEVHGVETGEAWKDTSSIIVRNSSNVEITNSSFHHMGSAVSLLENTNVKAEFNEFKTIRSDGIHGGGNVGLTISQNVFSDFFPKAGDHADAIQLWTTNATRPNSDITITDNLIVRGAGEPVQGVFLKDEKGTMPYSDVTIANNAVVGMSYRGISVTQGNNVEITDNTVVAFPDRSSGINVDTSGGILLRGNTSTSFNIPETERISNGNRLSLAAEDKGVAALQDWIAGRATFSGAWGTFSDFVAGLGVDLSVRVARPQFVEVQGTAFNDRLNTVTDHDSRLMGGSGDDALTGNARTKNELHGGRGDDTYHVMGANDLVVELASEGADHVKTRISYSLGENVEHLTLMNVGLTGTGNELANTIRGSVGVDTIYGMDGDDVLVGDAGNDILDGGAGDDDLRGGAGDDDLAGGSGQDYILGGDGADRIDGGAGADMLRGDQGNDRIFGGSGDDSIFGGAGNDSLAGDSGNDVILGGEGNDIMWGGAGADVFRFQAGDIAERTNDVIGDFERGADKIDLRSLDANTKTAKDDAFSFVGFNAFTKKAGELRMDKNKDGMLLSGDVNGDGVADFSILVQGLHTLASTDFQL